MKALRKLKKGTGNISLVDIKENKTGVDDIKIKVVVAGICGTDIHTFFDKVPYDAPVTMGHEFSGIVVECGKGVVDIKPGDRVTAEASANTCGKCNYCIEGNVNLCIKRKSVGRFVNGAFADYVVLNKKIVHKIPDSLDFTLAALSEPLSVVIHALKKCNIKNGSIVVINGPGLLGILITMLACLKEAKVIVLGLDRDRTRLDTAKNLGAFKVINIEREDYINTINKLSNDIGADFLFECSGASSKYDSYFDIMHKGGEIIQLGLFEENLNLDFNNIVYKEIGIKGSFSQNWQDFEDAIQFLDIHKEIVGKLPFTKLPLNEWEKGFKYAMKGEFLKVFLETGSV